MARPKEVVVKFNSRIPREDRQDFAKCLQYALHVGFYLEGPFSEQSNCKFFLRLIPRRSGGKKLVDIVSLQTKKWMNSRELPEVVELFDERGQLITSISRNTT
jgi:hypothetical protein